MKNELQEKIEKKAAAVEKQKLYIASLPDKRLDLILEAKQNLIDLEDGLARLIRRANGIEDELPSDEQLALLEFVNSSSYDEL